MPIVVPVTIPPAATVATTGVALLQIPPAVVSARVVFEPRQIVATPVIAAG